MPGGGGRMWRINVSSMLEDGLRKSLKTLVIQV
jgi:hypothetical protein